MCEQIFRSCEGPHIAASRLKPLRSIVCTLMHFTKSAADNPPRLLAQLRWAKHGCCHLRNRPALSGLRPTKSFRPQKSFQGPQLQLGEGLDVPRKSVYEAECRIGGRGEQNHPARFQGNAGGIFCW